MSKLEHHVSSKERRARDRVPRDSRGYGFGASLGVGGCGAVRGT